MKLHRRMLLAVSLLALGLAGAAAQAQKPANVTSDDIAKQIEAKLHQNFTAENLYVQIMPFDDPCYLQAGRLQWIMFSAAALTQDPVTIRNIFVKCLDVTLDLDKLFDPAIDVVKLTPGRAVAGASVTEADLNVMVGPTSQFVKQSGMEDLKMELTPGQIRITGKYKPLFGSEVELTGTLEVVDQRLINFVPTGAKLNGLALPTGILKAVLKRLNPLIDFKTVPLQPTVKEVTILDHEIRVIG